ncbi:conserved hypothetical protein [Pediculus humanus corporis]|uniref:Uncharacterized protein n=1 Tax=Pediculus humanus subsp. corporis TaxID=121224 RepID=E0VSS8_PEDHC|nr:uncharacterized protein Phum_PHUM422990 [Pediculus humanus corporis]EEB16434.1 conserved hypothetical protein [Pediculus humanus corporis]
MAIEKFEEKLKLEKKRIKAEAKEAYKRLLLIPKPIPELNLNSKEIDMDTHSVQITELSAAELAKNNHWIGVNESLKEWKCLVTGQRVIVAKNLI